MSIVRFSEILTTLGKADNASDADLSRLAMLWPLVEANVKEYLKYSVEQATYTHFLPDLRSDHYGDDLIEGMSWDVIGGRAIPVDGLYQPADQVLQLPEIPVRSITSVHEDLAAYGGQAPGAFAAGTLLTAGRDYWLDFQDTGKSRTGFLYRIGSRWPRAPRSVKVVYVAGYTRAELDYTAATSEARTIKLATLMAIAKFFNETKALSPLFMGQASGSGTGGGGIVKEKIEGWEIQYDASAAREITGMVMGLPQETKKLLEPLIRMGGYF